MGPFRPCLLYTSDCILFFRLGDFYEMFFDDAKLASKELELTLTGKDCEMCIRDRNTPPAMAMRA